MRSNRDLTHWRPAAFNGFGTGGWWNFGGLLREVYVRKIDTIDIEDVHVLPHLRKVGGPAKVEVRAYLRNMTDKAREVDLVIAADGRRIRLPGKRIPANSPRLLDPDVHDQAPAAVGARRPRAVPAVGDGRGGRARSAASTGCASACASSRPRAAG